MPLLCHTRLSRGFIPTRLVQASLVFSLLASVLPSQAAPENITDGELALLPPYCQDVQAIRYGNEFDNPSPRASHWVAVMGKSFWHLHHYCWGLIHLRRSQAPGLAPAARQGMVQAAVSDYIYVVQKSPADFPLAPEIYLRIGEAELLLGRSTSASEFFQRARALKPDYWPAYTRWIDVLIKTKQTALAKDLAAEGLRHAPTSRELISRYKTLGGDPAAVVPARAAVAAAAPASAAAPAPEPTATGAMAGAGSAPSAVTAASAASR